MSVAIDEVLQGIPVSPEARLAHLDEENRTLHDGVEPEQIERNRHNEEYSDTEQDVQRVILDPERSPGFVQGEAGNQELESDECQEHDPSCEGGDNSPRIVDVAAVFVVPDGFVCLFDQVFRIALIQIASCEVFYCELQALGRDRRFAKVQVVVPSTADVAAHIAEELSEFGSGSVVVSDNFAHVYLLIFVHIETSVAG